MQDVLRQIDPRRGVCAATAFVRIELIESVDGLNLHAGLAIERGGGNDGMDRLERGLRALVAIAEGRRKRPPGLVEAHVIDRPAGNADARDALRRQLRAGAKTAVQLAANAIEVPAQPAGAMILGAIFEAADHGDARMAGLPFQQRDTAALRPEVDGDEGRFLGVGTTAHRRNASGKPPSTGIKCPVVQRVCEPARKRMARAQSSGSMG